MQIDLVEGEIHSSDFICGISFFSILYVSILCLWWCIFSITYISLLYIRIYFPVEGRNQIVIPSLFTCTESGSVYIAGVAFQIWPTISVYHSCNFAREHCVVITPTRYFKLLLAVLSHSKFLFDYSLELSSELCVALCLLLLPFI